MLHALLALVLGAALALAQQPTPTQPPRPPFVVAQPPAADHTQHHLAARQAVSSSSVSIPNTAPCVHRFPLLSRHRALTLPLSPAPLAELAAITFGWNYTSL